MPDEFGYLKPTLDLLQKEAEANKLELDESFVLPLENYTLRRGTRSLSDETKKKIVEEVGKATIETAKLAPGKLGGAHVEAFLKGRCPDGWLLCYETARRIVADHGLPGEMETMDNLVLYDV